MKQYNRIIVVLILAVLAGWLACLNMPTGEIAAILEKVMLPAALYITVKGKGSP